MRINTKDVEVERVGGAERQAVDRDLFGTIAARADRQPLALRRENLRVAAFRDVENATFVRRGDTIGKRRERVVAVDERHFFAGSRLPDDSLPFADVYP